MSEHQLPPVPWPVMRLRRVPLWAVLLLSLAIGAAAWAVGGWRLIERRADLSLEGRSILAGWSLRWDGPSGPNGAWLDLAEALETEPLEIEVAAAPEGAPASWHWIYRISVARPGGATVDVPLKPLAKVTDEAIRLGPWSDFTDGPGIVYGGPPGGRLNITVPAGTLTIYTAKTPTSGTLAIRYGGEEYFYNLAAPAVESITITLQRRLIRDGGFGPREVAVPSRGVESLRLVGPLAAGGGMTAHSAVVVTRVAGFVVARQPILWSDQEDPEDAAANGPSIRITAEAGAIASVDRAEAGLATLRGAMPPVPLKARLIAAAIVIIGVAAALCLAWIAAFRGVRAAPAEPAIARWGGAWFWAALAAIVGVRIWMALWAPPLVTSDTFDYLVGGAQFVERLDWSVFGGWRVPGYGLFLSVFWSTAAAWGQAAAAGQAVLGVITALMCRSILLRVVTPSWANAGMLLVGLDPELLTFERIMLSESLSAFLLTLIVVLILGAGGRSGVLRVVLRAALIGVCCAALVYVRANFQTMIVLAPIALLVMVWHDRIDWRRATAAAVIAGAVAAAGIAPWLIRNHREFGEARMVVNSEFARVVFLWNNLDFTLNQVKVHDLAEYKSLKARRTAGMEVWSYISVLAGKAKRATNDETALQAYYNQMCADLAREAEARRPFAVVQSSGKALATQLGLWVQGRLIGNRANVELAAPLRGVWQGGESNILFNTSALAGRWDPEIIDSVIDRVETSIGGLRASPHAGTFNDLFSGYRFLRPLLAALMIIGGVIALRRWDRGIIVVVMVATANAAALAVLLYCPLERYRIAITPLIAIAAVYALYRITAGSRRSA